VDLPEPPRPDLRTPPPPPTSRKDHSARNWTIAVVVIFGLIILGAMNKNASDSTGNENGVEESGIDQGFGTEDASGDVTLGSCREGPYSHESVECMLTIHNSSDGTSDYYIEGQALRDGIVIGGLINALVSSVPGGGTAEADLTGVVDGPWDSVRITTVQRTAS
jgi:hypothetical protein